MKIRERIASEAREAFTGKLKAAFEAKFNVTINSRWAIMSERLVTERIDGKDFTPEQICFIGGFEAAWLAYSAIVG